MSGLANTFDLKDEKQAEEYLKTVNIEYSFQCHHEKRPDGCHRLADFLDAFRREFSEAAEIFRTNCEENRFSPSCFKIGLYHMLGRGAVKKDMNKALEYFDKGCQYGSAPCCQNAALLLQSGTIGPIDFIKGTQYLKRGCVELQDVQSCQLLSAYYITGKKGVPKDMTQAFKYAKLACDEGHVAACVNISQMYRKGEGVEKDLGSAHKYREKAEKLHKELKQ